MNNKNETTPAAGQWAALTPKQWDRLESWIHLHHLAINRAGVSLYELLEICRKSERAFRNLGRRVELEQRHGQKPTAFGRLALSIDHCPLGPKLVDENSIRQAAAAVWLVMNCTPSVEFIPEERTPRKVATE